MADTNPTVVPSKERTSKETNPLLRFGTKIHLFTPEKTPDSSSETTERPSSQNSSSTNKTTTFGVSQHRTELLLIWKDQLVIAVGYFCFSLCYYSTVYNLDSWVDGNIAFITLATIFAAEVVSSLFIPTSWFVLRIGCKCSLVVSAFGVVVFTGVQFLPASYYVFLPAGFLLGIAYTCTWVGLCTYTSHTATRYAQLTKAELSVIFSTFLGVVTVFGTLGGIVGNGVSFVMYTSRMEENDAEQLSSAALDICGPNYCQQPLVKLSHLHQPGNTTTTGGMVGNNSGGNHSSSSGVHQDRQTLLLFYIGVGLVGPAFLGLFLNPRTELKEASPDRGGSLKQLLSVLVAMTDPQLMLLSVSCFNLGLLFSFASGPFARAFVTCTFGAHTVSLVATVNMASYCLAALVIGLLVHLIGLSALMLATSVLCEVAFVFMLQWPPDDEQLPLVIGLSAWMGAAVGFYATAINTSLSIVMAHNREASFAFYRGFYGLGSTLGFAWANHVCVTIMLYTLCSLTFVGTALYLTAEFRHLRSKKNST